jgi:hypothetical protein
MGEKEETDAATRMITRMLAAVERKKALVSPNLLTRSFAGASTAPDVMKHIPLGAGSATERSSKGGKSGGGMGGQQAGGIKGGGKRKTHAGRK